MCSPVNIVCQNLSLSFTYVFYSYIFQYNIYFIMDYFDKWHIYKCNQTETWKPVVFWDVTFLVFRTLTLLPCEKVQTSFWKVRDYFGKGRHISGAIPDHPATLCLPADCTGFSKPRKNSPADLEEKIFSANPQHS